jgi:4-aminobutyrate--pyruvate transaminase
MQQELHRRFADHPLVGEVRGVGLVGAIELVSDKEKRRNFDPKQRIGARLVKLAEANGVISRNLVNDVLAFSPPLIITEAEIDEMIDGVASALDELAVQLRREKIAAVA